MYVVTSMVIGCFLFTVEATFSHITHKLVFHFHITNYAPCLQHILNLQLTSAPRTFLNCELDSPLS